MHIEPVAENIEANRISIRQIRPDDNETLAKVIRATLTEFGAARPGTVYYDSTTDALYELFRKKGSIYYVAEKDGSIVGGGGIYPSDGLPEDTCELVKMYLVPEARGRGIGKHIILKCLEAARQQGFQRVYLETMPELETAIGVYEKFGFRHLDGPLGNTGHFGCSRWMLLDLGRRTTNDGRQNG